MTVPVGEDRVMSASLPKIVWQDHGKWVMQLKHWWQDEYLVPLEKCFRWLLPGGWLKWQTDWGQREWSQDLAVGHISK